MRERLILVFLVCLGAVATLWAGWMSFIAWGFYGVSAVVELAILPYVLPAIVIDAIALGFWVLTRKRRTR